MASVSQKVPIPLPLNGVLVNKSPREVGSRGLVSSQNWIYKNGEFRVRPGLNPILPIGVNLIREIYGPDADNLAYVNDASYFITDDGTLYAELFLAETPPTPEELFETWLPWKDADATLLTDNLSYETYSDPDDPDYLYHGEDGYAMYSAETSGEDEQVSFCSPLVPVGQGDYEGQIKVSFKTGDSHGFKHATVELVFVRYDGVLESWGVAEHVADVTVESELDWVNEDVEDTAPIRVSGENDGYYNHAFLRITLTTSSVKSYFAFSDVMINRGSDDAEFIEPSASAQASVNSPMGVTIFEATVGSPVTVMATDSALWELSGDLEWSAISDGEWANSGTPCGPVTKSAQPVFRTFDGSLTTEDSSDRYLIAVNGEGDSMYWNGTGSAAAINLNDDEDPDTTLVARCVAISNNRVLYGNIGSTMPDTVYWTNDLTIAEWQLGGLNNDVRLADTPGEIVSMMEMGNLQTAIYKTDAIYMAIGQGMLPPFRFELKTASVDGPASPLSVVAISDGMHIYLSAGGDVIIFDGVRPRSLGAHLQSYIQGTMNHDLMDRSFSMYDKENKDVYFFYPPYGADYGYNCVVVDVSGETPVLWPMYFNQEITCAGRLMLNISKSIDQLRGEIDQLPGTIDDFGSTRPVVTILNAAGEIFSFDGTSDAGYPISHHLQTGMYDLGNITSYLTVKEIDHLFDAANGESVDVDLLTTNFGGDTSSVSSQTMSLTRGVRHLSSHRATGRLFSMRIGGESQGHVEWLGSEASVVQRGLR